ncbi:MAG: DNA polymerase IV [Methanomicrobiales archaeon]|nr:DNA polymerase IV [Methanomicrobiales archaeon]
MPEEGLVGGGRLTERTGEQGSVPKERASRIVMLVDLDSFYASVEEQRHPELRGRPVVICMFSGRTEDSGAVATANYRARALGVKAGMPIPLAKRLVKEGDAVFLPADREHYREVSDRIMEILGEEADALEQVSIDEAYLDVTARTGGLWREAERIASQIKGRIREQEGVTCSIGIGPNKFVAKMATSRQKPDGLTIVREEEVQEFLAPLLVEELHGVGPKTAEALREMGVITAKDLAQVDVQELVGIFGEARGVYLKEIARGIDPSPVAKRERTQFSRIATLKEDTRDEDAIMERMVELGDQLERKLTETNVGFRTLSIILIDTRLRTHTKSETLPHSRSVREKIPIVRRLLQEWLAEQGASLVRRVGVRVSNLSHVGSQRTLTDFG